MCSKIESAIKDLKAYDSSHLYGNLVSCNGADNVFMVFYYYYLPF